MLRSMAKAWCLRFPCPDMSHHVEVETTADFRYQDSIRRVIAEIGK
jgi:hypothetical protein